MPRARRRVVLAQPPRPASAAQASAGLRALRERLGLPATASPQQVIAAAEARLAAPGTPPAPAPVPAPPRPAPNRAPLISATAPSLEELAEEARWERTTSKLFPEVSLGPATAALAAAGTPLPSAAEVDGARRDAWQAQFDRNAEASDRARAISVDASRSSRIAAGADARAATERAQDRFLFGDLP